MRQKGELSPADIDRNWPHQVVLSARACEGGGYTKFAEHEASIDADQRCDRPRKGWRTGRRRLLTPRPAKQASNIRA